MIRILLHYLILIIMSCFLKNHETFDFDKVSSEEELPWETAIFLLPLNLNCVGWSCWRLGSGHMTGGSLTESPPPAPEFSGCSALHRPDISAEVIIADNTLGFNQLHLESPTVKTFLQELPDQYQHQQQHHGVYTQLTHSYRLQSRQHPLVCQGWESSDWKKKVSRGVGVSTCWSETLDQRWCSEVGGDSLLWSSSSSSWTREVHDERQGGVLDDSHHVLQQNALRRKNFVQRLPDQTRKGTQQCLILILTIF